MQSYVEIDGLEVLVDVEPQQDSSVRVTVGSRVYLVDVAGSARSGTSLLIDGYQFEVHSRRLKSTGAVRKYALAVNGAQSTAAVTDPLSHLAQLADGGCGSAMVEAYMPGRVVTLLVAEGDTVEQGQGILVLEAMKMENEIAAEASGVVERFFVEQGQAVEGGDPLFEVTPEGQESARQESCTECRRPSR